MVCNVSLEHILLRVLLFSSIRIMQKKINNHIRLNTLIMFYADKSLLTSIPVTYRKKFDIQYTTQSVRCDVYLRAEGNVSSTFRHDEKKT